MAKFVVKNLLKYMFSENHALHAKLLVMLVNYTELVVFAVIFQSFPSLGPPPQPPVKTSISSTAPAPKTKKSK